MGEAGWLFGNPIDYFKVWITPTSYNPTAGTGISTSASRMLVSDDFHSQENFTTFSATRNLNAFAGQTVRLIFEWINNGNSGSQPPAAIDNISLSVNPCTPTTTSNNSVDTIVNMSLTNSLGATYSNATSGNSGYLYTNNQPPVDLARGTTSNQLSMTFGTGDISGNQYSAAWIDFNGNGIFESSENIAISATAAENGATVTYAFTVPATATLGQKRIRLRGGSDSTYSPSGACATTQYGDTEDYNVNIVDASISTNYTWNGNVNASWQIASNWTPNGIPSSFDNITITASTSNTLNITDRRTINNFTLNGPFNMAAASNLIIRGNVAYNGSATANLNCASKIEIRSATTQTIPPLTYGNLDATGGNRTLPSTGTVGICNVCNLHRDGKYCELRIAGNRNHLYAAFFHLQQSYI